MGRLAGPPRRVRTGHLSGARGMNTGDIDVYVNGI